jgi:hypothetical protein
MRTNMTLTKAGEVFQHSLIHRPRFLSLTLSRSKKRARGKNSPASIHIPMTIMRPGPGVGRNAKPSTISAGSPTRLESFPCLQLFAPYAAAVVAVTQLKAVGRFDVHREASSRYHLLGHIPPRPETRLIAETPRCLLRLTALLRRGAPMRPRHKCEAGTVSKPPTCFDRIGADS